MGVSLNFSPLTCPSPSSRMVAIWPALLVASPPCCRAGWTNLVFTFNGGYPDDSAGYLESLVNIYADFKIPGE